MSEETKTLLDALNDELIELGGNVDFLAKNEEFKTLVIPIMKSCSDILKRAKETDMDNIGIKELLDLTYPMISSLSNLEGVPEELLLKTSHMLDVLVNHAIDFKDLILLLNQQNHTPEELIYMEFNMYQKKKKANELYSNTDLTPQLLIKQYYTLVDEPRFQDLVGKFKAKYIENECAVEEVHEKEERDGMKEMYEYVSHVDKNQFISVFTLQTLHKYLFSKVPYPEFGGHFAESTRVIKSAGLSPVPANLIVPAINSLFQESIDLANRGRELGKNKSPEEILPYINDCIELNCKLIKIHPFENGNGRSVRAFTNLLFSLANIPPVYVKENEREKYLDAMEKALSFHGERREKTSYDISLNDTTAIKKFYYYKICDSLIDLDIKNRVNYHKDFVYQEKI